ncbi:aminotransferase class V-fold PLP-dependent enzyme [Winogradskyella maritima]|uniref:Aminotransferase class V-fold PLP-dependent enzyme n=1 Tax=Winogradskyella maritima TaxID=1517766 RepID=A0ABV8ABZ3_9FLAO|nr:aminotransferase class V-fold PLP-dependent enzyme [Winogradskyella maritima]
MTIKNQRNLFDIPEDIAYLNTASLSPSFLSIEEAGIEAIKEKSRPYVIPSSDFFEPVSQLKKQFADIIGADDHNRIASLPSVSYGLANVANNVTLKSTDEILVIDEQFPSNYYIWKRLVETYGASVKVIHQPEDRDNCGQLWNEAILEAINENTALVAMGQIHWANGIIFNLKAIREKTRKHDALLIVDGSQSIGALPFSVKEIQPDALVCAGYKWLFGPYGCAYGYYGPYFDDGVPIEENWSNRLYSENLAGLTDYQPQYKPLASRYNVGENGSFIYVRMQSEALRQVAQFPPDIIQEYCDSISTSAIEELVNLGFYVHKLETRAKHLFGVEIPQDLNIEALKQELAKAKIYVSFRGRYMRLSCHLFNTKHDFNRLVETVKSIMTPA